MKKESLDVVIPVYCSKETLPVLVEKIDKALSEHFDYRIILVDDHSKDDTFNVIKNIRNNKITAVRLAKNYGQQLAVFYGLTLSKASYTVIMDDDLEQNPKDIIALYEEIKKGYDVVYGLNEAENKKGYIRSLGSGMRDFLFDRLTDKPKEIKVCSFRILNSDIRSKVTSANKKFIYISMEILKNTNKIGNVYIKYDENKASNYSYYKLLKLIMNIYIYYSKCFFVKFLRKPLKAFLIEEVDS